MLRICSSCGVEKEIERFVRNKSKYINSNPYRKICKDCKNAARRTGRENTGQFKKGMTPWNKGIPATPEEVARLKAMCIGRKPWSLGKIYGVGRNPAGGKYKEWKLKLLDRDGFKCPECGGNKNLDGHHIIPWNEDESKRFDVDNGIILCRSCHSRKERYQIGHKHSDEARKKISEAHKGRIPWNKGKKYGGSANR